MEQLSLKTEKFFDILNTVLSTLNIDEVLTTVVKEIKILLGADRCTLFLVDKDNNELYSKVLHADNLVEIRVPITRSSLAGYSSTTGRVLNIKDAYDEGELKSVDSGLCFDRRWDEKSGYRTRSVLAIPVKAKGEVVGVFQALNKPDGFSDPDVSMMEQLAFLLGIAVNNALSYQTIEEEKKLREYIIDDIEEGICILDTKKRIISANKFLEVMSGMRYSTDAMAGEYFFELFPNFANTQLEEKINESISYGFKMAALLEVLEVKIIPYLDEKGRVKKLILIFTRV
ncbi:MAG: GAF domain-containing protein [Nitrospiraceae bacterium]|nr:GAF domain-containing protein [Nitrospiraceae bacterium]